MESLKTTVISYLYKRNIRSLFSKDLMYAINNNTHIYCNFNDFVRLKAFIPKTSIFNEEPVHDNHLHEKYGFPMLHSLPTLIRRKKKDDFYTNPILKSKINFSFALPKITSFEMFGMVMNYLEMLPEFIIQDINTIKIYVKTYYTDEKGIRLYEDLIYDSDF